MVIVTLNKDIWQFLERQFEYWFRALGCRT